MARHVFNVCARFCRLPCGRWLKTGKSPARWRELDKLTDWERRPRSTMRVGLEPMLDLAARLGDPQKAFRAIHVAGTKGKGSVSALIEAALVRAALKVGRYGSPHVEHVTERVSLQGDDVDEATLARALTRALDAYEAARQEQSAAAEATWFDLLTSAAFLIFRDAGVDWAVVEVGLGGRLELDQYRLRRGRGRDKHRARAHRDSGSDPRSDRGREGRHPQAGRRPRHHPAARRRGRARFARASRRVRLSRRPRLPLRRGDDRRDQRRDRRPRPGLARKNRRARVFRRAGRRGADRRQDASRGVSCRPDGADRHGTWSVAPSRGVRRRACPVQPRRGAARSRPRP